MKDEEHTKIELTIWFVWVLNQLEKIFVNQGLFYADGSMFVFCCSAGSETIDISDSLIKRFCKTTATGT